MDTGALVGEPGSTGRDGAGIACAASGACLSVWTTGKSPEDSLSGDIYAAPFDATTGSVGDASGVPLSVGTNPQLGAAVACTGGECIAVWLEGEDGHWEVRSVGLDSAQCAPDGDSAALGTIQFVNGSPSVSCAQDACVVAWADCQEGSYTAVPCEIHAASLDAASGAVIDGAETVAESVNTYPSLSVACDAQVCSLAYVGGADALDPYAEVLRLDPGTADALDAEPIVVSGAGETTPQLASSCDDGSCLVAWTGQDAIDGIAAAQLDLDAGSAGAVLTVHASTGAALASAPSLSCDAGRCVLTWSDGSPGALVAHASRIDLAGGEALDPIAIDLAPTGGDVAPPAISCLDGDCLATWGDGSGLYGTWLDPTTGDVADPGGLLLATPGMAAAPSLAAFGERTFFLVSRVSEDLSRISRLEGHLAGAGCPEPPPDADAGDGDAGPRLRSVAGGGCACSADPGAPAAAAPCSVLLALFLGATRRIPRRRAIPY